MAVQRQGKGLAASEVSFFSALANSLTADEMALIKSGQEKALAHNFKSEAAGSPDESVAVHSSYETQPIGKEALDRTDPGAMFLRDDVSPAVYAEYLTKKYKAAWVNWEEPETVWATIERDHGIPDGSMSQVAKDKISAFRAIYHHDTVFDEMDAFENAALAWNDVLSNFGVLELARPEQMAFFMVLVKRLFSPRGIGFDVRKYVAGILGTEGWVVVPRGLEEFQVDLDDYNLEKMSKSELMGRKKDILSKIKGGLVDDDDDPAEIGAARIKKVALYLKNRSDLELRHRAFFNI